MTVLILWFLQLLLLNHLPFIGDPELYIYPYLTAFGLIPYRQIIDQHFPGLFFLPLNFFTLGFKDPLAFKILLWLILMFQSVFIYKITRKFLTPATAVLAVILYSVWQPLFDGHHLWLDTILPLFTLPALFYWLDRKYFRVGLFLGLALIFKQTVIIPIIFLGIYLLFKNLKLSIIFFSLPILINLLLLFYFWSQNALKDFFFWTIQFNLTSYSPAAGGLTLPKWLILLGLISLIASFVHRSNIRIRWISIWAGLFLIGSLARPDLVHFHSVIPFIFIILAYSLSRLPRLWLLILGICLVSFPIVRILSTSASRNFRYFDESTTAAADYLKRQSYPGREIFILGAQPHLYALSETIPAGRYFSYQLPWYLKITQPKILSLLESSPPGIIVFDPTAGIDNQSIFAYAPELVNFLFSNYSQVQAFGNLKIYNKTQ